MTSERWDEARARFEAAAGLARSAGDRLLAGRAMAELGRLVLARGKLRQAGGVMRRAIELIPEGQDHGRERASLLLDLARSEINLGEYREALEDSRGALELFVAAGDDGGIAHALFRIGAAHDEMGEYDAAHRHFHRALELCRKTGNRTGEAMVLSALGTSYRFIGDPTSALRLFEEAGEILGEQGQARALGWNERDTGAVLEDLGRAREAEARFRLALERVPRHGGGWVRADLLFHMGRLALRSGDRSRGVALLRRGLSEAVSSQNVWADASIRVEMSRAVAEGGDVPRALALAEEGARMFHRSGAQDLEWDARYVRGTLLERAGAMELAMAEYREAMAILESVRSSIGVPTMRSRFSPKVHKVYEAVLRLLHERHRSLRDRDAARRMFAIAERYRARTFAEMLAEGRIDLLTPDDGIRRQERDLRARIASIRTRLGRFADEVADRRGLENELFEAERRHEGLLLEVRRLDPRYAGVIRPQPVDAGAAPRLLGPGVDLVAYHLGEAGSYGWFVRGNELQVFELPSRDEVENLVLFFRSLIVHRNDPPALREVSRRLYRALLGPVSPLPASDRPLVIIPDGALFLLPFEALLVSREGSAHPESPSSHPASGDQYVIQERPVHYLPSLSVLAELKARPRPDGRGAGLDLLAVGNPLVRDGSSERRLIHTGSEMRRVAALFPHSLRMLKEGADAHESAFRACLATPARAIHLATHGILDGAHPERSGLVFTPEVGTKGNGERQGDGFLNLAEIFDLRLSCDLVVLSACESAGGEILRGEGLLGLSRGFFFAGAGALVASLWKVDDRATEELMVSFYENLGRGHSISDALRRSKLERIAAAGGTPPDPSLWAGFIVIGEGDRVLVLHPKRWPRASILILSGAAAFAAVLAAIGAARRRRTSSSLGLQKTRRSDSP